jgi:hypothetical protein
MRLRHPDVGKTRLRMGDIIALTILQRSSHSYTEAFFFSSLLGLPVLQPELLCLRVFEGACLCFLIHSK